MKEDEGRNLNMDILKTLAIIGVCYCHYGCFASDSTDFSLIGCIRIMLRMFSSCAVPLFFMVNGYFALKKEYSIGMCLEKIKCLSLKTVIWLLLSTFFCAFISEGRLLNLREYFRYVYEWRTHGAGHIWYMITLCIVYLLYPYILMLMKSEEKNYRRLNKLDLSKIPTWIKRIINSVGQGTLGIFFLHRFSGEIAVLLFSILEIDIRNSGLTVGIISTLFTFLLAWGGTVLLKQFRVGKWLV